jgi:hypothetical protein
MNDSGKKTGDTEELELENVAGIFFILVGGLLLGLLACIIDRYLSLCLKKRKVCLYGVVL